MKKKLFSIILSLAMVITMMPAMTMTSYAVENQSAVLLLNAKTSGKRAVKLSWNKVDTAKKYVVYGNRCGKKYKKIATVKSTKYTVKKIKKSKLKAHRFYKFYVVAYNGKKKVATSRRLHFATAKTSGKYANARSITATKSVLNLDVGKTGNVGAKVKIYKNKKHVSKNHGYAKRYFSKNSSIAKVSKTGVVKGISAGTTIIYIQDIGGLYCKVKVIVKGEEPLREIGGRVFYADPEATGGSVKFYDSEGNDITSNLVISADGLVSGIDNAYYYRVTSKTTNKKDKFYIYATSADGSVYFTPKHSLVDGTIPWRPTTEPEYEGDTMQWGGTGLIGTSQDVGQGKINTLKILSSEARKLWSTPSSGTTNIWLFIENLNARSFNGCNDWYIGSKQEIAEYCEYYHANHMSLMDNWYAVWTSTESNASKANYVGIHNKTSGSENKTSDSLRATIAIRSIGGSDTRTVTYNANISGVADKTQSVTLGKEATLKDATTFTSSEAIASPTKEKIGGKIFYINDESAMSSYEFYTDGATQPINLRDKTGNDLLDAVSNATDYKKKSKNYTISSWNTKADGTGTTYTPGSTVSFYGDTTLYAQWKEVDNVYAYALSSDGSVLVNDTQLDWGTCDTNLAENGFTTVSGIGNGKYNSNMLTNGDTYVWYTKYDTNYGNDTIWCHLVETINNGSGYADRTDWYIGTSEELQKLYAYLSSKSINTLSDKKVWSSMEADGTNAEAVDFNNGTKANHKKSDSLTEMVSTFIRSF